ncbi:hypothetical protein Tco_1087888 [Tanacetum coccineum]
MVSTAKPTVPIALAVPNTPVWGFLLSQTLLYGVFAQPNAPLWSFCTAKRTLSAFHLFQTHPYSLAVNPNSPIGRFAKPNAPSWCLIDNQMYLYGVSTKPNVPYLVVHAKPKCTLFDKKPTAHSWLFNSQTSTPLGCKPTTRRPSGLSTPKPDAA